jgi:hypothetical protein
MPFSRLEGSCALASSIDSQGLTGVAAHPLLTPAACGDFNLKNKSDPDSGMPHARQRNTTYRALVIRVIAWRYQDCQISIYIEQTFCHVVELAYCSATDEKGPI